MEVAFAHPKIQKFFETLTPSVRAEIARMLFLLEEKGNEIREPDSKSLGRGLFELRIIDYIHVRIIYMFSQEYAIVLHAFVKKTGAIPRGDMTYARRMQEVWKRLE